MKLLSSALLCAVLFAARADAAEPAAAEPAQAAAPQPAEATDKPSAASRKRTVLRFDDDSIHGDLTRPDGELVQAPRRPAQQSLLRVRRNFLDRALAGASRGE